MILTTVYDCSLIELSKHHHEKGNITVVENNLTVPFDVQRTYYLYVFQEENLEEDMPIGNCIN